MPLSDSVRGRSCGCAAAYCVYPCRRFGEILLLLGVALLDQFLKLLSTFWCSSGRRSRKKGKKSIESRFAIFLLDTNANTVA